MTDKRDNTELVSSGVEALIERLRDEGVAAGVKMGERVVEEAKREAESILKDAQARAKKLVAEAEQEAARVRKGGEDALRIAMRDIVLELKARLSETVDERVRNLIASELEQEAFLKSLILEVAGRVREERHLDEKPQLTLLLPRELVGLEELRQHPLELSEGSLSHFILNVAADVLREGVSFANAEDNRPGLRIFLQEEDIQIDLTDERIAEILLEHLQPRFRAMLEGMVK